MTAKVSSKLKSILDWEVGKVLISESNNTTLSNKESELVLSFLGELAELDTANLRSEQWCEVLLLNSLLEKVWEGWIGILSVVVVFKWLEWLEGLLFPDWKIVWVLFFVSMCPRVFKKECRGKLTEAGASPSPPSFSVFAA